jgi:hypothetical protein
MKGASKKDNIFQQMHFEPRRSGRNLARIKAYLKRELGMDFVFGKLPFRA